MHAIKYDLASGSIALHAMSPALRDSVRFVLGRMGVHPSDTDGPYQEGEIVLLPSSERIPVPDGARLLSVIKRPQAYGRTFTAWREGETLYLSTEASLVEISAGARSVRGHIHADDAGTTQEARLFLTWLMTTTIALVLREQGVFAAHAAVLCRGGEGVLIAADSNSGKSTLSYSLVRHGWDYLSDDFVVLHEEGGEVKAAPFRRTFGLDIGVEAYFPELDRDWDRPYDEREKWAVRVDALYPGRLADWCRPRVLLFPEIVGADETVVREVPKVEALHRLVRQSGLLPHTPETSQRQMTCLAKLVEQARCYRLFSGRDLLEEPQKASAIIEPLLRQAHPTAEG